MGTTVRQVFECGGFEHAATCSLLGPPSKPSMNLQLNGLWVS